MLKLKNAPQPIVDADYPCDARNGSEVWERVKAVDCYWNLSTSSGQPTVSVYLEKERESWWKSAVHGAEEIDTTKVDSTRDMYDYDDETQGAIRKVRASSQAWALALHCSLSDALVRRDRSCSTSTRSGWGSRRRTSSRMRRCSARRGMRRDRPSRASRSIRQE